MRLFVWIFIMAAAFAPQQAIAQDPGKARYQFLGPAIYHEFNKSDKQFYRLLVLETDTGRVRVCEQDGRREFVNCSAPASPFGVGFPGQNGRFRLLGLAPGVYTFGSGIPGGDDDFAWVVDGIDGRARGCLIGLSRSGKKPTTPDCRGMAPGTNDKFP